MVFARDRRTVWWGATLGALGVGLCAVPLFDLVGYELSFALALAASLAGLDLGAAEVARARREHREGVFRIWLAATARLWLLLLLPLAISFLNQLRVRNCDLGGGLAWYAILPGLSAPVACAVGVTSALATTRHARALAYGLFVGSLVWALKRFLGAPPVNAFDPFGGYFPGTLYDEEVAIPRALWWARGYHLSAMLAALSLAALFVDERTLTLRVRAARGRVALSLLALSAVVGAATLGALGGRLGFARSAGDIARALGGERRTTHFVLHYSPSGPFAKEIDLYATDHELRWLQLHDLFQVDPGGPIHAFLFDSPAQKQSLMGAAHTSIAKPWRRELYLQYEAWPHSVLMHELAHVFAGAFGDPLFHISRSGWSVNVGLIEGVAVAAAWHGSLLTPHQQAHVMRAAKIAPPLGEVLGLGFLRFNNSAAYAEAGSFCRWLLTTRGAAPLERVYREGGSDASFRAAYGVPRSELIVDWGRFVDGIEVPDRARKLAEERFSQPSVFHKVCAHELALRREQAAHASAAGDHAHALALLQEVCKDDPDDPDNLLEIMDTEQAARRDDDALATARQLLSHPKITPQLEAHAHALIGDLALARHDLPSARAAYAAAEALPLDEGTARLVTVKRMAAALDPPPEALVSLLIGTRAARDAAATLADAEELVRAQPDSGLYQYLLGRQLEARGQWERSADALERSRTRGLPDARFVREADRLSGISRFRQGRFDLARADFAKLAEGASEGVRLIAEDWLRRIELDAEAKRLARP